jgi:hypothetical protein
VGDPPPARIAYVADGQWHYFSRQEAESTRR